MEQEEIFTNKNGVINMKKLERLFSGTKISERLKTVSTPIEQITNLYPAVTDLDKSIEAFKSSAEQMKKYSYECWLVFEIMMQSGCRVSEVLAIRAVDLLPNGMIRIKGKKKSNDRIITTGNAIDYILKCKKNNVKPFQVVNRKFVWSIFKKYGIQLKVGSSTKMAVTHAIRHLVIASAKEMNIENNTTSIFIGHKNKKNTEKYGNIKG